MYNRAEIIEQNFRRLLKEGGPFPQARVDITLGESGLTGPQLVDLFESQVMSRALDLRARELKNENKCFYTIGSSGHEGNAVFGRVFRLNDMAFLHYRSGALMVQRAKQLPASTPLYDGLLSFVAASDEPIAGGRHKVWGSRPLLVPPQTSTIASHLPKAVGAALSIRRARDLQYSQVMADDSVVICSFGDASANHATAQVAFNTASHVAYRNIPIPLVFLCEDNGIGISVPTPEGWIQSSFENRPQMKYFWADGLNLLHLHKVTREAETYARIRRKPVFLHTSVVRLMAHAGSDPEWSYKTFQEIERTEFNDPLLHSARIILENKLLSAEEILALYESVRERVRKISDYVVNLPKLTGAEEVRASLTANRHPRALPPMPSDDARRKVFGQEFDKLPSMPQHMAKLINYGLADILLRYKNSVIFGEDVAQKGGVYNVTDGLHKKFGPRRVFNSMLDETSILGNAIGFAHNGLLPIPEIQFLAYVHNAEDQIRGEASTLAFFSQGQFTNPMIIRVAGLAYQKGFGGHFHNDNSLAIFRDIPGLIIAVPSNGADAVKMMRACVRTAETEGRVVIFIEPIALYMTKDLHAEGDKEWSFTYPPLEEEIAVGDFGVYSHGVAVPGKVAADDEVLILTYGNGYFYSRQAEKELREKYKVKCTVVDLRWIAPVNWEKLMPLARNFTRVCIVEECRKTGSFSEQLVAGLVERWSGAGESSWAGGEPRFPKIKVIAADDCFIPLGPAAAAGLPKKAEIVAGILELKGI
ncbi:thiamine pyrophosphate-dependent enzyme [Oligoflexus tunisiensis]|uniref:thiamine pyrophosphate-dependent enzyme n=1 Tax=Oligoflexus tunisiensis TaxID=708132 RepID=UPI000A4184DF|nr:thiamine pyrophosphate-dependent enzyme [Oligoflexus tunisiensis]